MKKNLLFTTVLFLVFYSSLLAQPCFSGGTGADGAYTATSNITINGGTYNFTTFNIDAGVTVSVTGTQPLVINCTGNATINGTLHANGGNGADGLTYISGGVGGTAVAGGGNGGAGTFASGAGPITAFDGVGAGAVGNQGGNWSGGGGAGYATAGDASGNPSGGFGGPIYGDANISGLEAGSGGGGGSGGYDCGAGGGGGGGGVIVMNIAATLTIGPGGTVSANGGNGGSDGTGNCGGGGGGSGGALYLSCPNIINDGTISCIGGTGGASMVPGNPYYGTGANGGLGRIRVDHNAAITGSGTTNPSIGAEEPLNTPPVFTSVAVPNDTLCAGDMLTLYGDGDAASYSWTGGITDSVAFTPTLSSYTVTATGAGGCTSTGTVNVQINPLPVVNLGPDVIQPSAPAILDAGAGFSSYLWSTAATSQTISVIATGTYMVTVTDNNGCANSDTAMVIFTAGINPDGSSPVVKLYPNPSHGVFYLEINNLSTDLFSLSVMDLMGKVVYNQAKNVAGNTTEMMNLEHLSNGIYILQINADGQSVQQRIVIDK